MKVLRKNERGDTMVWVLILVVLLAAGGVGYYIWHKNHTTKVTTTVVSSVPICGSGDLALSQGTSEGAAGTIYKHAVVTNTTMHACTLTGYPAAFLVDAGGLALGSGAAPSISGVPVALTLAAGGKAHAVLGFPQAGNFDPGVCSAASVSLKMYIPSAVTPVTAAWVDHSCPGFSAMAFQPGA